MAKQGVRTIGGRDYYIYLEYNTKKDANLAANRLRKRGQKARVYKMGGEHVVYATRYY